MRISDGNAFPNFFAFHLQHCQLTMTMCTAMWGVYISPQKQISTFKDNFKPHYVIPYSKHTPKLTSILPQNAGTPTLKSLTKCSFKKPGIVAKEQKVCHSILGPREKDEYKQTFSNITKGMINPDKRIETRSTTSRSEFMPVFKKRSLTHQREFSHSDPFGKPVFGPMVTSEYAGCYQGRQTSKRKCYSRTDVPGAKLFGACKPDSWHVCAINLLDEDTSNILPCKRTFASSIPMGDPDKLAHFVSNHTLSYSPLSPEFPTVNCKGMFKSSLQMGDNRLSHGIRTTVNDDFINHQGRTFSPKHFPMNKSSIPDGDLNPLRVKKRLNYSTMKASLPMPPTDSYASHVDTTGLRLASHVHFGKPQLPFASCKSTMEDSYCSHTQVPPCKSIIPPDDNLVIQYYPKITGLSTMKNEYTEQERAEKTKLALTYLDYLKQTHWVQPYAQPPLYSTTQKESFSLPNIYPKKSEQSVMNTTEVSKGSKVEKANVVYMKQTHWIPHCSQPHSYVTTHNESFS